MNYAEYKYTLGKPDAGFHTHYFGFAIFDLIATILIAFIIMIWTKNYFPNISHSLLFGLILVILLLLAEYMHKQVGLLSS